MKAAFLVALTVLMCANAWSAPPNKNQYILVKNRYLFQQPNASAPASIKDAVSHGGGHVDYEGWDRLIVTLPDNAVEAIAKHVATKYLQLIRSGPPPAAQNAVSQLSSAALAAAHSSRPPESSAHLDSRTFRAVANRTSTWDSGTYAYDGAGNITSIGNDTFTYDSLSRLSTSNTKGNAETYAYDDYGNLTSKTTTPVVGTPLTVDLSTNTATNHLSAQTYDTAGNLTGTSSTETNVYDPFNMMRRKDVSGYGSEYYIYNANDERIAVISGCTTAATPDCSGALITVSGRDEAGKVLRQFDVPYPEFATQGWLWLEDYVYRENQLLAAERPAAEGGRRHFHLDHLGSPRLVTSPSGQQIAAHDYYPFGVEITSLRQETPGFDREEPMKFTGHERDFNIGTSTENTNYNDYMHARSTASQWGRFLSVDPSLDIEGSMHLPQKWNRYAYVGNNPLKYADPDGKDWFAAWLLGESYRNVSTWDAIFSRDTISDVNRGRQEWAEDHQAITHGFSPVPTTKSEVAMQVVMMGPIGEFIGTSFGKLGTIVANQVGKITGFSGHAIDQIITRGVSPALLKAVTSKPMAVLEQSAGRKLFLTKEGAVVLDKGGKVITAYTAKEFDKKILDLLERAAAKQ